MSESTDVIVRGDARLPDGNGEGASLRDAAKRVAELVETDQQDVLEEAQRQAEAHKLYEERAGHQERANHYARLKLLAEAGLGALDPNGSVPNGWRTLTCGWERGVLLKICDQLEGHDTLSTTRVANEIRRQGWAGVPGDDLRSALYRLCDREGTSRAYFLSRYLRGPQLTAMSLPWRAAKAAMLDAGGDPRELPADRAGVERDRRRREASRKEQATLRQKAKLDAERKVATAQHRAQRRAVAKRGGAVAEAYSLIHRARDATDRAIDEADDPRSREGLTDALYRLHSASDRIVMALGLS